jgi:hypothetical protein
MTLKSNAEELALVAQEIGAEVIRGPVRYPGRGGGFDIGETDLEELLWKLKDQEVVLVIAPLGPLARSPWPGSVIAISSEMILSDTDPRRGSGLYCIMTRPGLEPGTY